METHHKTETHSAHEKHYKKLIWMAVLSYIVMYQLMYSMVDKLSNDVPNINQFYMATLMTASMIIIELILMRSMYKNKKLNAAIMSASAVVLVLCFLFIQNQTGVSEKQFLKSMIPHHASAVLMVKESNITDAEIKNLANNIITSQDEQIDFMKAKLKQINNK